MLTAGDEFGRTQRGNNNAYAQDNDLSWVDWAGRDRALEVFVATLSGTRAKNLTVFEQFPEPGTWHRLDGMHMTIADWESSATMGVAYEAPLPDGRRFRLNIDRRLRSVFVDIVQK
jgi:glycogen operon protein